MLFERMVRRTVVVFLVSTLSASALANGSSGRETALARVEAARAALAQAREELRNAELELAAAEGGSLGSGGVSGGSVGRVQGSQPAEDAVEDLGPSSFWDGWERSVVAGITGSSGNSENFSGRVSLTLERKTDTLETTAFASYLLTESEGVESANRGELGARQDWLLDGPWRVFAQALYEYDEFQAWQHRMSGAAGVGYEFVNNEKTTLVGRVGVGGSYESGSNAMEEFVPEGLVGLDLVHQVSENTTFKASSEYNPSFDDFGEFRLTNSVGLEVVVDAETGMTLNVGAEHRHDSQPGVGVRPNDLDYYLSLGWKF